VEKEKDEAGEEEASKTKEEIQITPFLAFSI
jgi:hypothetical protein